MARPTAIIFCFLYMEDTALPSGFLFFSEFALARSRHRLIGALVTSASNCGSMSTSVIGEGPFDVARLESDVAGGKVDCALDRGVEMVTLAGMMILALTGARYPVVPAEDVGATLKVIVGVYMTASSR